MLIGAAAPVGGDPQRLALGLELERRPGRRRARGPRDARAGHRSARPPAQPDRRRGAAPGPPPRARSGASSSAATTPSVSWMKWSWTVPSATQAPIDRTSRRPSRRIVSSSGRSAISTRNRPRSSTTVSASAASRRAGRRHSGKVLPNPSDPMPPLTETSQDVTSFFTNPPVCRVILNCMNRMSRADLHVHSSASQISKLGVQRSLRIPECATRAARGLRARQAPRDGFRDDHRSRHDRRSPVARSPARHVHLRGADRASFKGERAGRTRALLRDHPRRSRVAPGQPRRRRGVRRVPARPRDHGRARPPLLRRRGAAHRAPPAPPGPAVPDLGDAQRLAGQGTESAGVCVHRDPRGNRHRRVR